MKGIIFNLVEDVVRRERGDRYWDDVVDASGLHGAYTSLGTYPDHDLAVLADVIARREQAPVPDVVRHVGHEGIALLAARYPEFFAPHRGARSFLLALNSVVHPEVRRLYQGAVIPTFEHRFPSDDVVEMLYRSERGRCDLAEGLVLGAGAHYGEALEVGQSECVHLGDPHCVIRVRFL
jgi:hypothetical protein